MLDNIARKLWEAQQDCLTLHADIERMLAADDEDALEGQLAESTAALGAVLDECLLPVQLRISMLEGQTGVRGQMKDWESLENILQIRRRAVLGLRVEAEAS